MAPDLRHPALYFNMVPAENRAAVFESLTRSIEKTSGGHVAPPGRRAMADAHAHRQRPSRCGLPDRHAEDLPGWVTWWKKAPHIWSCGTATPRPAMNSGNHVMQIGDLAVWMYEDLAAYVPTCAARFPARRDPPIPAAT